MTEPVTISVPLVDGDKEWKALGAIVYLFEQVNFDYDEGLKPIEKDRIARYLFDRYTIPQNRSE
jgi:hypothetical protein